MTPKERMLAAISHEEPDRVPTGEWQFGREILKPLLGREPLCFNGLRTLEAFWEGRRDDVVAEWKHALVEITRRLGWDAVLVHLMVDKDAKVDVPRKTGDKSWRYENGAEILYSEETNRVFTVKGGETVTEQAAPAASGPTDSQLELARHVRKELGETHFIFTGGLNGKGTPNVSAPSGPVVNEVENWVDLYSDPDAWKENRMKILPSLAERVLTAKKEGMDGIAYSCDYGTTRGPFMSPEMFRKAVLPFLAKYVEIVHQHGLVFLHHACGNNQPLMDMIVEAGVDVYQAIQTEMDIIMMKKRYGGKITLWGGVPAASLVSSKKEDVYEESKKYLAECMPGGGYIFGTSHSIMPGAKYENYAAMLKALDDFGWY